jgi:non-ribosomal peptide synthetase component E (peptide arylation enzyme)
MPSPPNNTVQAEEKEEDCPRDGLGQGEEPMDRQWSVQEATETTDTHQVSSTAASPRSTSLNDYDLLLNRLRANTLKYPTKRALAFLDAKGAIDHSLTYAELDQATHQLAEHLQSRGMRAGDRCVFVFFCR